jgi:hypothetical protein
MTSHVLDGLAYYKVRSATLYTRNSMQLARVAFESNLGTFFGNFSLEASVRCSRSTSFSIAVSAQSLSMISNDGTVNQPFTRA